MRFKVPNDQLKQEIIVSDRNFGERFSVFNIDNKNFIDDINQLLEKYDNEKFDKFINNVSHRPYARTNVYLGYDEFLKRPIIIKTAKYRDSNGFIVCDYDEKSIKQRRYIVKEQIKILNDIQSPLLPEPIDYFFVENNNMPKELSKNEPILIFDYQSGMTMSEYMYGLSKRQEKDYNEDQDKEDIKAKKRKDIRDRLRIVKSIIIFLKELEKKNYAYQSLNPKNLIILKNNIPRLLGIGTICRTKNGILDENHINYRVCELGFSAPELNNPKFDPQKITSSGVGAFTLGVLIHQLIGEFNSIDLNKDILGEYGQLKYPNVETEKIIKSSPLKPQKVHNLICELCKENVDERLTDYDKVLEYIDDIIGTTKTIDVDGQKTKVEDVILADKVFITDSTTEIKHCEQDNSILEEKFLKINVYRENKRGAITTIDKKGYICNKCGYKYIDDYIYDEIKSELNDIELDDLKEDEEIYIGHRNNVKNSSDIKNLIKIDENIYKCGYDNYLLEEKDVLVSYFSKNKKDIDPKGKLHTRLLTCNNAECSTAYINKYQVVELERLLPDHTKYEFNCTSYKDEFKTINGVHRLDNRNNCTYDLEILTEKKVLLEYYNKNNEVVGSIATKLLYCKKCGKYYISKDENKKLNKLLPNNSRIKINGKYEIQKSPIIEVEESTNQCSFDKNKLEKYKMILLSKPGRYHIYANVLRCKECKKIYISKKEINRIKRLLPKGYKNLELQNEFLFEVDKVTELQNYEINTCISDTCNSDNSKIKYGNIRIAYYNKEREGYICKNVRYCDRCKEVYLDNNELEEINKIIGDAHIKFKSENITKLLIREKTNHVIEIGKKAFSEGTKAVKKWYDKKTNNREI